MGETTGRMTEYIIKHSYCCHNNKRQKFTDGFCWRSTRVRLLPDHFYLIGYCGYLLNIPSQLFFSLQDFKWFNIRETPIQLVPLRLRLVTPHTTGLFGQIICYDQPRVGNATAIPRANSDSILAQLSSSLHRNQQLSSC